MIAQSDVDYGSRKTKTMHSIATFSFCFTSQIFHASLLVGPRYPKNRWGRQCLTSYRLDDLPVTWPTVWKQLRNATLALLSFSVLPARSTVGLGKSLLGLAMKNSGDCLNRGFIIPVMHRLTSTKHSRINNLICITLSILTAIFRLDALALSVIATGTWLAGWLAVCHGRYCIKTTKPIRKLFGPSGRLSI